MPIKIELHRFQIGIARVFSDMAESKLHSQNIVACIWDFDKTLIAGYMQTPLFERYGMDEKLFWAEVNQLPEYYQKQGVQISHDTIYLNHLLTHVKNGALKGLNNEILKELGKSLNFYPGLPHFFQNLKDLVSSRPEYKRHNIVLEHYIISTGLAAMIRGSTIAPYVENAYGCEFIENPLPPLFSQQQEFPMDGDREIGQIGIIVDNTIKTRFIFKINKGTNKNPNIDVNAKVKPEDRRVPIQNMIYIADGPSDIPVFSVVKKNGGKTYAVYDPDNPAEFEQNDKLLQVHRIHAYGPADYTEHSSTARWLRMHVLQICDRMVKDQEHALSTRVAKPPQHLHKEETASEPEPQPKTRQEDLFSQ